MEWHIRFIDIAGGVSDTGNQIRRGPDRRLPSVERFFNPGTLPGFASQTGLHYGVTVGRVRLARRFAFLRHRRPLWRRAVGLPRSGSGFVQLPSHGDRSPGTLPVPNRYRTIGGGGVHGRSIRAGRAVLLSADAGGARRCAASASSAFRIATAAVTADTVGSVVGARRRAVRRRRQGRCRPARCQLAAISMCPTASASASTATAPSSRASISPSAAKASSPF